MSKMYGFVNVTIPVIKKEALLGAVLLAAHQAAYSVMFHVLRTTPIWRGHLWAALAKAAKAVGVNPDEVGTAYNINNITPNERDAGPIEFYTQVNDRASKLDFRPDFDQLDRYSKRTFRKFWFYFGMYPDVRHDEPDYAALNENTNSGKGQKARPWRTTEKALRPAYERFVLALREIYNHQDKYVDIIKIESPF